MEHNKHTGGKIMDITLTARQVSERYNLVLGTLANMRCRKEGPSYIKVGKRKVLYRVEDIEKYLAEGKINTLDPRSKDCR